MSQLPKTDVVIIGLGAAGGIASYVLTQAGLNVVGIEAGPYRSAAYNYDHQLDEIGGESYRNQMGEPKVNHEVPTWRPNAKAPVQPPPVPPLLMMNGVGGTSVHYTTQSWRFRRDDFKIRTETIAKYGEKALPAGTAIVDWPVTYDELEPYYDKVEYLIGVSGQGGSNPFESPRKRGYPLPPLREMGFRTLADQGMKQLGYHPFPQPSAIISQDYDGRPACTYCGFCSGYGCWNNAKSSTLVSAIPKAVATGKLDIRPNSRVMQILTDNGGNASGVKYLDDSGQPQIQPAAVVILSGYVYPNNRLLLLSKSAKFPNGLANNHGQVGKYYLSHSYVGVNGLFSGKRLNIFNGAGGQNAVMDDLNGDNFDHKGLGFIRGATIQAGNGTLPIASSSSIPPNVPGWGSAYKRWLHENAQSVGSVLAQQETLPYETNYIDLDPTKKDPLGVPVVRLTYDFGVNEKRAGAYMANKMTEILKAMGAVQTWPSFPPIPIPINTHAYGGTRMGDDPSMSVVNKYSLAHEVPNLAILGGSTFCSTTGYNPTETIEALAWYAADNIAQNFNKIAV